MPCGACLKRKSSEDDAPGRGDREVGLGGESGEGKGRKSRVTTAKTPCSAAEATEAQKGPGPVHGQPVKDITGFLLRRTWSPMSPLQRCCWRQQGGCLARASQALEVAPWPCARWLRPRKGQ